MFTITPPRFSRVTKGWKQIVIRRGGGVSVELLFGCWDLLASCSRVLPQGLVRCHRSRPFFSRLACTAASKPPPLSPPRAVWNKIRMHHRHRAARCFFLGVVTIHFGEWLRDLHGSDSEGRGFRSLGKKPTIYNRAVVRIHAAVSDSRRGYYDRSWAYKHAVSPRGG